MALLQRVSRARVAVAGEVVGEIGPGLLVLLCAEPQDSAVQAGKLVDKLLKLRLFADEAGMMSRSVVDVQGGLLIVSQFTLAVDVSRRLSGLGSGPRRGEFRCQPRLRRGLGLAPHYYEPRAGNAGWRRKSPRPCGLKLKTG